MMHGHTNIRQYNKMISVGIRNIVERSRNHFCHENVVVYSLRFAVDLHVAVSSIRCSVLPTQCGVFPSHCCRAMEHFVLLSQNINALGSSCKVSDTVVRF
jgi:hypothetical protein